MHHLYWIGLSILSITFLVGATKHIAAEDKAAASIKDIPYSGVDCEDADYAINCGSVQVLDSDTEVDCGCGPRH
jgi:hypothetical protein